MKKNVFSCMSKYDFTPVMSITGIDYTEVVTVPDQVLSMYDIYMKYAVSGQVTGLANNIRPHTQDNLDDFDESVSFDPEEDVDILLHAKEVRTSASLKRSRAESFNLESGNKSASNDAEATSQSDVSNVPDGNQNANKRSEDK